MRYQAMSMGSSYPYPNHNINPDDKGMKWCMSYAKAAFYDWSFVYTKGVFSNNNGDYEKFAMYEQGKQPVGQYQDWMGVDKETKNTHLSVDWTPRPIASVYLERMMSRLVKQEYDVIATPIDMLAKSELDDYIQSMKAKLMVRQLIQQTNQELGSHPLISLQPGDPMDTEELEMRIGMNEQFNRSADAEMAISLGLYENDYKAIRWQWYRDLIRYGVAGARDWLGEDNKAKLRYLHPDSVIISASRDWRFRDIVHAGEAIDVPLIELATLTNKDGTPMFDDKQLEEFASSIAGKWGNPRVLQSGSNWVKPYDKFKCRVMDIEFYTYNDYSYKTTTDTAGNPDFRKTDYGRGKKSPNVTKKRIQYVYKCKWIIGTDYCYDWGMCYDQKRENDPKKKAKTKLSFHLIALNFHEMKATGVVEKLIPYIDEYMLTIYKIQNFKNRAIPSGWWIDMDALENIALNKGGAGMQPKELLQMFTDTGILLGRSKDAAGNPMSPNWKPVIPIENTAASELAMFYQDLINTVMAIEKITGYNEITTGNPNPKTLVPGYELANQSTQDALYPIQLAEEFLSLSVAEAVLCRMKQGIKKGGVSGYAPALNNNLLQFIKLNPDMALRDHGIILEKKTSDDQRMWLLQQMNADIVNGYLDSSDAVMLVNTHNTKQAQMIWAYKVRKAKEAQRQHELQQIQLNNQGASEAAMLAAQEKERQLKMEIEGRLAEKEMVIMGELKKEEMRLQAEVAMKQLELGIKQQMNSETNVARTEAASVTAQAKVISQNISSQTDVATEQIAGEVAIEKQRLANERPQVAAK